MNFGSLQKFSTPASLQRPLFSVPKVAVLESFNCNYSDIILLKVYIEVYCIYRIYSNKCPTSNKRPPPPPPNQTQISAHPHPTHLSE